MNLKDFEASLAACPVYDYKFIDPGSISFSEKARHICLTDCSRYEKCWMCPPNTDPVSECAAKLKKYSGCIVFSTVSEVSDIYDTAECLKVKNEHESITYEAKTLAEKYFEDIYVLSSGCTLCDECTYPDSECRFPQKAFQPVESHGIILMQLAEELGMEYELSNDYIIYFSMIFFDSPKKDAQS